MGEPPRKSQVRAAWPCGRGEIRCGWCPPVRWSGQRRAHLAVAWL